MNRLDRVIKGIVFPYAGQSNFVSMVYNGKLIEGWQGHIVISDHEGEYSTVLYESKTAADMWAAETVEDMLKGK